MWAGKLARQLWHLDMGMAWSTAEWSQRDSFCSLEPVVERGPAQHRLNAIIAEILPAGVSIHHPQWLINYIFYKTPPSVHLILGNYWSSPVLTDVLPPPNPPRPAGATWWLEQGGISQPFRLSLLHWLSKGPHSASHFSWEACTSACEWKHWVAATKEKRAGEKISFWWVILCSWQVHSCIFSLPSLWFQYFSLSCSSPIHSDRKALKNNLWL